MKSPKALIIALIAIGAMVFLVNNSSTNDTATENEQLQNAEETISLEDEDQVQQVQEITEQSEQTFDTSRNVQLFIDNNRNLKKDGSEGGCDTCLGKIVTLAQVLNNTYPASDEFTTITVEGEGRIPAANLLTENQIWGYFDERKVFVPPFVFLNNDGSGDLWIPAWEFELTFTGINANIREIITENDSQEAIYVFDSLLPSLKKRYDSSEVIWVGFYPDPNDLGKTILTSGNIYLDDDGSVTDTPGSYYLEVNWNLSEEYQQIEEEEDLFFVLI